MSVNLIEQIQQNLGYAPLQKIDPNTQDVLSGERSDHHFSQAAIPAVATALYKYSLTDEGAEKILQGNPSTGWTTEIFDEGKKELLQKVLAYATNTPGEAAQRVNDIALEAVKIVKKSIPANGTIKDVKDFLNGQRHNILTYLPPSLHLGDLLNDNMLDDNTNKMEGPVSSLMHAIGAAFSKPDTDTDTKLQ